MRTREPLGRYSGSPSVTMTHVPRWGNQFSSVKKGSSSVKKGSASVEKQVVRFRSLEKPKEDDFCLMLPKKLGYDDVVERVACRINLDDPSKIRLIAHNCYTQHPKLQQIRHRGTDHLSEMLIDRKRTSDILYYEVLDVPLPKPQDLKNLIVAFYDATKNDVVIHNLRLPKWSTVGDVVNELKTKIKLSHPSTELRLVEVSKNNISKILAYNEKIENINDQNSALRAEEVAFATCARVKRPSNKPENEASRKKQRTKRVHSLGGELEDRARHVHESEDRIRGKETKGSTLEPSIAGISGEQCQDKAKTDPTGDNLAANEKMSDDLAGTSNGWTMLSPEKVGSREILPNISDDQVSCKATESCFDKMAMPLLEMIEDVNDPCSLRLLDFNEIATNRCVNVGNFKVPETLESYAKDLLARHADIGTGNSPVLYMNEMAFLVLCCALKSMDTTSFGDITKSLILKWRDSIRGALQYGFKVDFLKDRLKLVTRSYLIKFARNCHEIIELQAMDVNISATRKKLDLAGKSNSKNTISRKKTDSCDISEGQQVSESSLNERASQLMEMLEDDKDPYSLSLRDFIDIASVRYVDVGIFTVPESLQLTAEHLLAKHPDIGSGNSPVHHMNEMVFVVLCCALKSMEITRFSEITKSLILKWRDAIRGALQFGLKVEFLKDHLKSAAHAYLAKLAHNSEESKRLQAIDYKIMTMEKELDKLKDERGEMYNQMYSELRKVCETSATMFPGETFGYLRS